jgi:hypothetical protein
MATLQEIASEVDQRAIGRPIGSLQDLRKATRGLRRKPADRVFGSARDDDWTFHIGGREELQFNLGFEEEFDEGDFRFGVAFSFETSRSLPTIDPLVPKVARFNDYLRENAEDFAGLWMWHHAAGAPKNLRRPTPIYHELVRPGVFVFLGGLGHRTAPDYDRVLGTLDDLLPLYRFVEGADAFVEAAEPPERPLRLGCPPRPARTTAVLAERLLSVELRHNELQKQLYEELVREFGYEHVGLEREAPGGGKIDAIVLTEQVRILFEIKTASTARGCIREALGQLVDYACWPGSPPVHGIVIVGSSPITPTASAYLDRLNERFPVPLSYRHVVLQGA